MPTIQQVCEDYAKARRQFKRSKLRWRVSNPRSSKYSLGWVPFKARACSTSQGKSCLQGRCSACGTATAWATMNCAPAVSAIHGKIANQRKDMLHKFSTAMVRDYGAVFVGDVTA